MRRVTVIGGHQCGLSKRTDRFRDKGVVKPRHGAPAQIHHRSPMAVLDADVGTWLDAESELDAVQALLARPSTTDGTFEVRAR